MKLIVLLIMYSQCHGGPIFYFSRIPEYRVGLKRRLCLISSCSIFQLMGSAGLKTMASNC